MNRPVMAAAERHRELVAGLAAERARLHEAQMVGIRRLAAAQQARLLGDKSQVLLVAIAAGRAPPSSTLLSMPVAADQPSDHLALSRPAGLR